MILVVQYSSSLSFLFSSQFLDKTHFSPVPNAIAVVGEDGSNHPVYIMLGECTLIAFCVCPRASSVQTLANSSSKHTS